MNSKNKKQREIFKDYDKDDFYYLNKSLNDNFEKLIDKIT
jgi:hypothetical protein